MNSKVIELVPEADTVASDLRRYADAIERGELKATTALVIFSDRVEQAVYHKVAGERIVYSALMGLCSYTSHRLYQEIGQ